MARRSSNSINGNLEIQRRKAVRVTASVALFFSGLFAVSAEASTLKPSAPKAVQAIGGDGLATVTWSKPATGGKIAQYLITSHPSDKTCHTPQTVCVITGLTNGTTYSFTLTATNETGTGPASRSSNKVTPKSLPESTSVAEINNPSFDEPDAVVSNGVDLWVANDAGGLSGNGSVSEINIATGEVTEINDPSFDNPAALALSGDAVWVANGHGGFSGTGSVSEIDIATGAVTQINDPSFDYPDGVTVDGGFAWVANAGDGNTELGSVSKIDVVTDAVTKITDPSIDDPSSITSNGDYVWLANQFGSSEGWGSGSVSRIDIMTGAVTKIVASSIHNPTGIATNGTKVWVTSDEEGLAIPGSNSQTLPVLSVIDTSGDAVSKVNGPLANSGVATTFDGSNAWIDNYSYVYEWSPSSGKYLQVDTTDLDEPWGIAADGTNVWVANYTGGTSGNGFITQIAETSRA